MSELTKYPRTPHLPFSPGATNDDRIVSDVDYAAFAGIGNYVVTEKMDGGNVTMTRNHFFARSLDSGTHPWDTPAKALWAQVRFEIPEGWRVSGESMYARRSVGYDNLPSYYLVFGIWDDDDVLLSWGNTVEFAADMGLSTVPTIYRGKDFGAATNAWERNGLAKVSEGFVVRNADSIPLDSFDRNVMKFVRANHVTTSADWRHRDDFELNKLSAE